MYVQVKHPIFVFTVPNAILLGMKLSFSRRQFIKSSGLSLGALVVLPETVLSCKTNSEIKNIPINAHLWIYASKFPPNWDCTPVLETIFSDLSYAGINGLELMEVLLRHDDAVERINGLVEKYNVPVSGSSYGVGFSMWDINQHDKILSDIYEVIPRLSKVGGKTFGISVGHKENGIKTEYELDAQALLLKKIRSICEDNGIEANLHNHTYEVENDMHDLKGTLDRIPGFKLGPDLNWLIRAGIDPVDFINTYGDQIVYLHIRDQYTNGTWSEYVGQGDTDFKSIATALQAKNFSGQMAIELAFPDGYVPQIELKENWKKSRNYVQKTFVV